MIAMPHVAACLQLLRVHTGTTALCSETDSRTHTHPVESRLWLGFYWMRMHCAMAALRCVGAALRAAPVDRWNRETDEVPHYLEFNMIA